MSPAVTVIPDYECSHASTEERKHNLEMAVALAKGCDLNADVLPRTAYSSIYAAVMAINTFENSCNATLTSEEIQKALATLGNTEFDAGACARRNLPPACSWAR